MGSMHDEVCHDDKTRAGTGTLAKTTKIQGVYYGNTNES